MTWAENQILYDPGCTKQHEIKWYMLQPMRGEQQIAYFG